MQLLRADSFLCLEVPWSTRNWDAKLSAVEGERVAGTFLGIGGAPGQPGVRVPHGLSPCLAGKRRSTSGSSPRAS